MTTTIEKEVLKEVVKLFIRNYKSTMNLLRFGVISIDDFILLSDTNLYGFKKFLEDNYIGEKHDNN